MRNVKGLVAVGVGMACLAMTLTACTGARSGTDGSDGNQANGDGSSAVSDQILGAWSSDEKGTPRLEFDADGAVVGSDGCNGISTTYTVEGDRVVLEQFVSTLKACQGVDDWLRGVRSVTVDGDTLAVHNESGDEIGQLQRDAE